MDDQADLVTDGSNDGGIDFLYYDEDEPKLILCQAKYTSDLQYESIGNELDKMNSTLENFRVGNTGFYNDRLKKVLQNALDRLLDEAQDNVAFHLYTSADINVDSVIKKLDNTSHQFQTDVVSIFSESDIANKIQSNLEKLEIVESESISIDRAGNVLNYESEETKGAMVNILSTSLISLYNKYANKGLFDLNIRRYINNKMVDTGIYDTLDKKREDFWFLNNGIIIACRDFEVDGNKVHLKGFSIVNGGQTTTLIGKYKGNNKKEFTIPCKIISKKQTDSKKSKQRDPFEEFFTKIAEASNSQKPIFPRDLKSNSPEMLRLARMLKDNGIFLEIKRGDKPKRNERSIKNDELAQLILSMVLQRPGTARSSKKTIFENTDIYSKIFKANYDKDPDRKEFLIDLVELHDRYLEIESKIKEKGLKDERLEVLKNGKQIIFAFFGIIYRLANNDLRREELIADKTAARSTPFTYGSFISNYREDDIDQKLENIVMGIIMVVADIYKIAYNNKQVSSVSNYFKTDVKYTEILDRFLDYLDNLVLGNMMQSIDIFKRKKDS